MFSEVYKLKEIIIKHEGIEYYPYYCLSGKLTIGVGRNLQDMGISHDEAMVLLESDIIRSMGELKRFNWYESLDVVRQLVLAELNFNIGMSSFLSFKKMIAALEKKDFIRASHELLNSKWATQVSHERSQNMFNRLLYGVYDD